MIKTIQIIENIKPRIDTKVRAYCKMPYPGHPHGCPMFGKRPECPPQAPLFFEHFNMYEPFTAVVVEFDIKNHAERMRIRHPKWTERQCRNPLYWQGGIRRTLNFQCKRIAKHGKDVFTLIPEAMGMDVVTTMAAAGIAIEFPVKDIVRKVAIIGTKRGSDD